MPMKGGLLGQGQGALSALQRVQGHVLPCMPGPLEPCSCLLASTCSAQVYASHGSRFLPAPQLAATNTRILVLEEQRQELGRAAAGAGDACQALRDQEEGLKAALASALSSKYKLLLATAR